MVVGFFFKKVVPIVFLYYGAIQLYVLFHLYTGESMIHTPTTPAIEPTETRKKLVENVLAIYQCRATRQSFDTFADDVKIEDHSAYMEGLDALKNGAFFARKFKAETLRLVEHHFDDQFILELKQKYTFCSFQMTVPSVLYMGVEGKGPNEKVKTFRDEWYGKRLVTPENTPFAFTGVNAYFFRQIHGRLFNLISYAPPKE